MVARRRHELVMTHKTLSTWSSFAHTLSMRNIRRTRGHLFRFWEVFKGWGAGQVLCVIKHVCFIGYRHGRGRLMDDHR